MTPGAAGRRWLRRAESAAMAGCLLAAVSPLLGLIVWLVWVLVAALAGVGRDLASLDAGGPR